jgi:hypothetical protein
MAGGASATVRWHTAQVLNAFGGATVLTAGVKAVAKAITIESEKK